VTELLHSDSKARREFRMLTLRCYKLPLADYLDSSQQQAARRFAEIFQFWKCDFGETTNRFIEPEPRQLGSSCAFAMEDQGLVAGYACRESWLQGDWPRRDQLFPGLEGAGRPNRVHREKWSNSDLRGLTTAPRTASKECHDRSERTKITERPRREATGRRRHYRGNGAQCFDVDGYLRKVTGRYLFDSRCER
jgi:hypothetical protein